MDESNFDQELFIEGSESQSFSEAISSSIQYLYFLRFSILFWVSPAIISAIDRFTPVSTLTRGILTPPSVEDFTAPVFFAVSLGMVALLTARVVVLNGFDRFKVRNPVWLSKSLGSESDFWAWRTLAVAQLPAAVMLWCYWRNGVQESVITSNSSKHNLFDIPFLRLSVPDRIEFLMTGLIGLLLAAVFWWIVNAIYYSLHDESLAHRTLLLPRSVMPRPSNKNTGYPIVFKPLRILFDLLGKFLGYGYSKDSVLGDGHRILVVTTIASLFLYVLLCPFTAPLPHPTLIQIALFLVACTLVVLAIGFRNLPTDDSRARNWACLLFLLMALYVIYLDVAAHLHPEFLMKNLEWSQGFPILVPVLILLILLCFLFTALAFFADRHRVPVLTTFMFYFIVVPHLVPHRQTEHYFEPAATVGSLVQVLTPAPILKNFEHRQCLNGEPCQMIIVTATGGGIHAGSWTATVLTQLELAMQRKSGPIPFAFHDRILYVSTVSGGSVGIEPFLREYYAQQPFESAPVSKTLSAEQRRDFVGKPKEDLENPLWFGRIRRAAHCSELEAVAWGLEYGDLLRIMAPFLPAINKLTDRSAALEEAIDRNVTSQLCDWSYGPDDNPRATGSLTLYGMAIDLARAGDPKQPYIPAFTFNTTAAETGGRFLLSNYKNLEADESNRNSLFGVAPSESYLHVYAPTDLHLSTAARLSATFPYVSSAAQIDDSSSAAASFVKTFHFVDGGYYDNDGVASATEFLEQAFVISGAQTSAPPSILFLEIRDGSDLDPLVSDEAEPQQQKACSKKNTNGGAVLSDPGDTCQLNPAGQLAAPLGAFWNAGHTAVTRRNRRELDYVLDRMQDGNQAKITHIVFDYHDLSDEGGHNAHQAAQPLSWYLTPTQMNQIHRSIDNLQPCVLKVLDWATGNALASGGNVVCNYRDAVASSAAKKK